MSLQYGGLRPRLVGWFGVPQQISTGFPSWLRYCNDVAQRVNQTLHGVWPSAGLVYCSVYNIFGGSCPPNGILQGAKFTLSPSLAFSCFRSVTARHYIEQRESPRQPNFAAWYKEWNYGTFAPHHFQQRAPPVFRGRPSRWA